MAGIVFSLQVLPPGYVGWLPGRIENTKSKTSESMIFTAASTHKETNLWAGLESTETHLWGLYYQCVFAARWV
jgi:hypothetical protein